MGPIQQATYIGSIRPILVTKVTSHPSLTTRNVNRTRNVTFAKTLHKSPIYSREHLKKLQHKLTPIA